MGYSVILLVLCGAFLSEAFVTDSGCGIMKICEYFPEGCDLNSEPNCRFAAWSLSDIPDSIDIELRGGPVSSEAPYLAFAFGTSSKMVDADLYFCTQDSLESGFIDQPYDTPLPLPLENGLNLAQVGIVNGSLHCKFTRPLSISKTVGSKERTFNLSTTQYHVLLAEGKMERDIISYHDWRGFTASKIDFTSNFDVEEALKNVVPKEPVVVVETTTKQPAISPVSNVTESDEKVMATPEADVGTTKMVKVDPPATPEATEKPVTSFTQKQDETTSGGLSSMVMSSWCVLLVSILFSRLSSL